MTGAYLPYAVSEIYCIIFAMTIWSRLSSSLGTEHEVRQLRNMLYSYLGMLVSDIFWALSENGSIYIPKFPYTVINAVTIISIACGCYFWFRFIQDRLHFKNADSRLINFLLCLPLFLVISLDTISIFTGWIFYIDAQGHYQSTSLFVVHTVVNYFYLLIPTLYSLQRAWKSRSRQERSEYRTYALYMIAPLISGILEEAFPYVPLLALNIFLMILILFLMIQNKQVYHDALTGLNNRRRLDRYLEEKLPGASAAHPILLLIMDINDFKAINDLHGHLEGDHALRTFASVLSAYAGACDAFAARYGGDEFCLVMDAAGHTPQDVAAQIQQRLQAEQDATRPYQLTVSIGYTVCDHAEGKPESVLALADQMLYRNKAQWHSII